MNNEKYNDLSYITGLVNAISTDDDLDLCYTEHCIQRMEERDITVSDILSILRCGTIVECQEKVELKSGRKSNIYKYKMTGDYLGRENSIRDISLIILLEIDRFREPCIKIQKLITVMWEDL